MVISERFSTPLTTRRLRLIHQASARDAPYYQVPPPDADGRFEAISRRRGAAFS